MGFTFVSNLVHSWFSVQDSRRSSDSRGSASELLANVIRSSAHRPSGGANDQSLSVTIVLLAGDCSVTIVLLAADCSVTISPLLCLSQEVDCIYSKP